MSHTSSVPLYWRLQKHKYNLIGTRCVTCNSLYYPPKSFCPKCRRKGKIEDYRFGNRGKILSYTVIRIPPEGFEKFTPYAIALIELEEGEKISGQIVGDVSKVEIGRRLETVFRKITEDGSGGLIHYGLKWKIVD
jgi:uncharacterized OB-fold protein